MGALQFLEPATDDGFDPQGYLLANYDVAVSISDGMQADDYATWHFDSYGRHESRNQLRHGCLTQIQSMREEKFRRLRARSDMGRLEPFSVEFGHETLAVLRSRDTRLPVPFDAVSALGYDDAVAGWLDENPTDLFLDVGAGFSPEYRHNVVYAEIAAFPTVDVLCFGEALPFDDGTFDGIVSLAVLEHCEDPFAVAGEMVRVLRPGGSMVVDWPFLQPVHGYPNHYFNATPEGGRLTFERLGMSVQLSVPHHLHPAFSLRWILQNWRDGLPMSLRGDLESLTVASILAREPDELTQEPWARCLSDSAAATIAAGSRLEVTKKV